VGEGEILGFTYRDLKVWQQSVELSVEIYKFTKSFPREEVFGLTSQLRRASVSIASSIAEGYGRASKADFRRFIAIARGSTLEVQTQLLIAQKLELGSMKPLCAAQEHAEQVGKMLWALMQRLSIDRNVLWSDS
jgi:four helix bundle protein